MQKVNEDAQARAPRVTVTTKIGSSKDLTKGSIPLLLLKFSLPMFLGLLSIAGGNLLVLQILKPFGDIVQVIIGLAMPMLMLSYAILLGFGVGISSLVARQVGAAKTRRAKKSAIIGVQAITLCCGLIGVLICLAINPVIAILDLPAQVENQVKQIIFLQYLTMIFAAPLIGANGAVRGAGFALIPGINMVIIGFTLVVACKIIVITVPAAEIETAIAYIYPITNIVTMPIGLGLIVIFTRYISVKELLRFTKVYELIFTLRQISRVSIPAIASQSLAAINLLIIFAIIKTFGLAAIAAFAIISRSEFLLLTPIICLQASMVAISGQNISAGRSDRIYKALFVATIFSVVYSIAIVLLFYFIPQTAALSTNSQEVAALVRSYFLIVALSFAMEAYFLYCSGVFNGIGKALLPAALTVLRVFVLLPPMLILGKNYFGIEGTFAAVFLANFCTAIIAYWLIVRFVPVVSPQPTTN